MYILSDIKNLPSVDFLYDNDGDYQFLLEMFSTRACAATSINSPTFLICDKLFSENGVWNLLDKLIEKGASDGYVFDADKVNKNIESFMPQVFEQLNLILFKDANWHLAPEATQTAFNFLKGFVPVFFKSGNDIWIELALVLHNDEAEASNLFYYALNMWCDKFKTVGLSKNVKDILFGTRSVFEFELIKTLFESHSIHYTTYTRREPIDADAFHENPPICVGLFDDSVRLMIYHRSQRIQREDVSDKSNPVKKTIQMAESYTLFGRKVYYIKDPIDVCENVLENLNQLVDDNDEQLQQHGFVRFRLPHMDNSVGKLVGNVGVGFSVQEITNLKKDNPSSGPHLILDSHDKFNIPLNQVTKISHQLKEDEVIFTKDESGLKRLMGFHASSDKRHYLYAKGEPGWCSDVWNMHSRIFGSTLNDFLKQLYITRGVNIPYFYISGGVSFFNIHSEDGNLKSLNVCIRGSGTKCWFFIPRRHYDKFQSWFCEEYLKSQKHVPIYCENSVQHKIYWVWVADIPDYIDVYFVEQSVGEFILVDSCAHHQGFNTGPNISYAFNFATKDWLGCHHLQKSCNMKLDEANDLLIVTDYALTEENKSRSRRIKYNDVKSSVDPDKYDAYSTEIIKNEVQATACDTPLDALTLLSYIRLFLPFETRLRLDPLYEENDAMVDELVESIFHLSLETEYPDIDVQDDYDQHNSDNEGDMIYNEDGPCSNDAFESSPGKAETNKPSTSNSALIRGAPKYTKRGRTPKEATKHCDKELALLTPPVFKCLYCVSKPFTTYTAQDFLLHYYRLHHSVQCSVCKRWYAKRYFTNHKKLSKYNCENSKPINDKFSSSPTERDQLNKVIDSSDRSKIQLKGNLDNAEQCASTSKKSVRSKIERRK